MPAELIVDRAHVYWDDAVCITDEQGVERLWDPPRTYEVRRGPYWPTAICVGTTNCPEILTRNFTTAADTFLIRPIDPVQRRYLGPPEELAVDFDTPSNWSGFTERDEVSSAWPGTRTSCTVDADGYLTFDRDATTAIYTTPQIDFGDNDTWELSHLVHVLPRDFSWLVGRPLYTFQGMTLADVIGVPLARTIGDLADYDLRGPIYKPDVTWELEVTVYDTDGVPGTFRRFEPTGYKGQYAQFRLTMTRASAADFEVTGATNASPIEITTGTDHGLQTGRYVRVFGVGGNTAANGTWPITVTGDDTFTLDDSTGSGSYTSGGTAASGLTGSCQALKLGYATAPAAGSFGNISGAASRHILSYDGTAGEWTNHVGPGIIVTATEYGAVGDGVTDDHDAIQAALDAAESAGGGTVILPYTGAAYLIDSVTNTGFALEIPNKVWLVGEHGFIVQLKAGASYPSATAMVRLGRGSGIVFNCRLMNVNLLLERAAGSVGVYSSEANEGSGIWNVDVNDFVDKGVWFASGCQQIELNRFNIIPEDGDSGSVVAGIYCDGVAGTNLIRGGTVNSSGASSTPQHPDGIYVSGSHFQIEGVHVERYVDGIHVAGSTTAEVKTISGHSGVASVTNLIHLGSSTSDCILTNLVKGGGTYIILDDARSVADADSTRSLYVQGEWRHRRVTWTQDTQTGDGTLATPDLGATTQSIVITGTVSGKEQVLETKRLDGCHVRGSGTTLAQEVELESASQGTGGNKVQFPDLGSGGPFTRVPVFTTFGSQQEVRQVRAVDFEVKRNGQTGAFATLSSADQTGAADADIPDLGGSSKTFVMEALAMGGDLNLGGNDVDNAGAVNLDDDQGTPNVASIACVADIGSSFSVFIPQPPGLAGGTDVTLGFLEAGDDGDEQIWSGKNFFDWIEFSLDGGSTYTEVIGAAGTQTITGDKTFEGDVTIEGGIVIDNAGGIDLNHGSITQCFSVGYYLPSTAHHVAIKCHTSVTGSNEVNLKAVDGAVSTEYLAYTESDQTFNGLQNLDGGVGNLAGLVVNRVDKTTTYTATQTDFLIVCDTTAGDWTLTLPAYAANLNRYYEIVTFGGGTLTIDPTDANIDDASTKDIVDKTIGVYCDSSFGWYTRFQYP